MADTVTLPDSSQIITRPTISEWILSRLSRVTSSGRFVPEVDGLRFFAIAGVILAHILELLAGYGPYAHTNITQNLLYSLVGQGVNGVRLFFSISGFILALPFAESHLFGRPFPRLSKYFTRRVTRLEPPYIISLIIGLVGVCICGEHFSYQLRHMLVSATYTHALVYHEPSTIAGILWSLEIEVQFYILAPLLTQVFRLPAALRRAIIVCVIALGMAFVVEYQSLWFIRLTILGNIGYFLVGFLAADLYLTGWRNPGPRAYTWDLILLAVHWSLTLLAFYLTGKVFILGFPLLVLTAWVAAFRGQIFSKIVSNRWLVVIGGMCYTTYLYHMMTIRTVWNVASHRLVSGNYWFAYLLQLAILCPIVLVVSSLLFAATEKPFMYKDWPARWKRAIVSLVGRRSFSPAK